LSKKKEQETELNQLQEENKEMLKGLGEHILRRMLASWLIAPFALVLSLVTIFVLGMTGILGIPNTQILIDLEILESINSDIFAATITVVGLIIGMVPIISFFYLGELKDARIDIKKSLTERKKEKSKEIKDALEVQENLLDVIITNMNKAVKTYTQIAVAFSAFSLLVLLFVYMEIGVQNAIHSGTSIMGDNIAINVLFNIVILFFIGTEVFPLVGLALYDLGYKIIRYKHNGKEVTLVIPEQ